MLRFGQIVRGLKPKKMKLNKCEDTATKIKYLEAELNEMKMHKHIDAMIHNEDLSENLSEERINQLRCLAEDYLQNRVDEIAVFSLADIHTILQIFKTLFKQMEGEKNIVPDSAIVKYDMYSSRRSSSKSVISQKSSRKQSGKSKDSLRQSRQTKERMSKTRSLTARSVSRGSNKSGDNKGEVLQLSRLDVLNNVKSKDSLTKEKSGKRSKIARKPSGSRRKSSTSDSQHEKVLEEPMPLSETLPSPSDAWRNFIESDLYNYNELKEQMDEHECQIKRLNGRYVEEVKKLNTLREWLDLCRGKLCQLQRQQELTGKIERDEQGDIIKSEQEIACDDMLSNGERQLVQQQETCLTIQTELQLYLQLYNDQRKKIDENFDAFCAERYQTAVAIDAHSNESEMAVYTLNKGNDDPLLTQDSLTVVKDEKINDLHTENNKYEELKSLATKQREHMLRHQYLNRKWVRSCRNETK